MRHCQWRYRQSANATLTPKDIDDSKDWPVDLGKMTDLRTDGVRDRAYVSLLTEEGWVDFGFGLEPPVADINDLILSYFSYPRQDTNPASLVSGQHELKPSSETQSNLPITTGEPQSLQIRDRPAFRRIDERNWRDDENREVSVQLDGLIVETVGPKAGPEVTLLNVARKDIRFHLENLSYLRATRQRPIRSYKNETARPQLIGYAGECTAGVLRQHGEQEVVFAAPSEIPDTVDKARSILGTKWGEKRLGLQVAVGEWLQILGLAESVESLPSSGNESLLQIRVTLENQKSHDWSDVGFGVSQLIPVLTAGLMQPQGGLLIVDLPEAHLHPLPQSRLADFFCSLALSGRSVLVETHSEMFFHRLRLRAEMHSDLAELIQVYFIDPPTQGNCCEPRPVGLRGSDEPHWPEGFLQEAWEMESWIEVVRQAKRVT
jgi:predicted ATPase